MTEAVTGLEQFKHLAAAIKGGDKDLRKRLGKALRDAGKPIATEVGKEGAQPFPSAGGLRAKIAAARPGVSATYGASPRISLSLRVREGYALSRYNDTGEIRHPIFGRKDDWSQQTIPGLRGAYDRAFEKHGDEAKRRVETAIRDILNDIRRAT